MAPEQKQTAVATTQETQTTVGSSILDGLLKPILDRLSLEDDKAREMVKNALEELLLQCRKANAPSIENLDHMLQLMIGELEHRVSDQMDELLHGEEFQRLESRWRGLGLLVERTDFSVDTELVVLSASKQEINDDLSDDSKTDEETAFFRHLYKPGIGQDGATPFASIFSGYEFDGGAQDVKLLRRISNIAASVHTPFFANASPQFFGKDWANFDALPSKTSKDIIDHLNTKKFIEWNAFRDTENARYIGLMLPHFALRAPYHERDNPAGKNFSFYNEKISSRKDYLFGAATYALAVQVARSYAETGLPSNVTGILSGGKVDQLPLPHFEAIPGQQAGRFPTDVLITKDLEKALAVELGFIPLVSYLGQDFATFVSLPSVQASKNFGKSAEAQRQQANFARGTQLDNILMISRFAHCMLIMQRDLLGSRVKASTIEETLKGWLQDYKCGNANPSLRDMAERPLKEYKVEVKEDSGRPGWYHIDVKLFPFDTYQGATIAMALEGDTTAKS